MLRERYAEVKDYAIRYPQEVLLLPFISVNFT
jgi:hypothetical protein